MACLKRRLLLWWATTLDGCDLRRVRLAKHVLPALEGVAGARHRREAIKALYSWLRKTGRVTLAEDPVAALPVGKGGVAQLTRSKVVPREHVLRVAEHLAQAGSRFGHALAVQGGTGWHTTEVVRFAAGGTVISPVPPHLAEPCVVAVLVTPIAKNGRRHYAKVTEPVAFAARLLVGKGISERHYYAAVTRACRELNSLHSSFHEKVAPRQCPSRSSFPEAAGRPCRSGRSARRRRTASHSCRA